MGPRWPQVPAVATRARRPTRAAGGRVEVVVQARLEAGHDGGQWVLWLFGLATAALAAALTTRPERRHLCRLRAGLRPGEEEEEEDSAGIRVHDLGLPHAVALVVVCSTARPSPYFDAPGIGYARVAGLCHGAGVRRAAPGVRRSVPRA